MEAMENVKICNSCGMPMASEEMYGTDANGDKTDEYCVYCMKEGQFGNPNETLEEMIATCVPFMVENGMPEQEARAQLETLLPTLKRWKVMDI